jgi:hypothetical protein
MQSEGWHQDDALTISMEALAVPARHKETHVVLDGNETAALDPSKSERTLDSIETEEASLVWSKIERLDVPPAPFKRYNQVVVATKVLGPQDAGSLKQMLCLLTAAYNRHVNYDVLVFTTLEWTPLLVRQVKAVVPETKLSSSRGHRLTSALLRCRRLNVIPSSRDVMSGEMRKYLGHTNAQTALLLPRYLMPGNQNSVRTIFGVRPNCESTNTCFGWIQMPSVRSRGMMIQ